ncbi:CrtK protein [Sphingomonas sp. Root710]|uniref:TspO/MBR family protein n=1 Tax=Sphingomonas sp. Root710 TaxID=1736594 RepID=UPI0006F77B9E|nr:TspO/MBR family protein [Sphingomonas sp. Root710]KRB86896.1 CrtK protein [Sphingomonas sp. Root710]
MAEGSYSGRSRTSFLRWALVTIPAILLLGMLSARIGDSGYGNLWFDRLLKPGIMPAAWVFPFAWSILYIMMGFALAMILDARGAKGRGVAVFLFLIQLGLNLAWSPVFFAMHRIMLAFGLIIAIFLWAAVATVLFWKIRRLAGLLMLPYLAWLIFAGVLNWQIHLLNPNGLTLVPMSGNTQIIIR